MSVLLQRVAAAQPPAAVLARLGRRAKRFVFLLHRWVGIGMCVLIALWFASGIVMMYVEYPELTEQERLAALPPLALDAVRVGPAEARATLDPRAGEPVRLRLASVLGRPAYEVAQSDGRLRVVFADDGTRLDGVTPGQALDAARRSGFDAVAPRHAGTIDIDQWTVSSPLDPHRPLHKIELGDSAGTVLYVSGTTGQIVRDTNRRERFWNWLGSTIHWIYPWQLRRHAGLWADLVIALSLVGLVSIASGALVGWWRLRLKRRYRSGVTPYRGVMKWHHLLGLGCLLFLATFMLSGLLSLGPWGVFDNATSAATVIERYTGGRPGAFEPPPPLAALAPGVKEIEWARLGGKPYWIASYSADERVVLDADGPVSPTELRARIDRALPAMLPEAALVRTERVTTYDDYYYTHHNRYRPLPVLRAVFADPEESWFHIDLDTGQVVNRLTATDRVARWLYNGLHSLDFALLFQRRPLWDVVVIALCTIGVAFSVTSVWIGWRRLARSRRRRSWSTPRASASI
ncbi:MAG TPA: PepSY domain-containing protein [Gammaproteobacteria bacterium]